MAALDAVLQPLVRALNRNIEASTPASELCDALQGRVIAIRVSDTALATWFCFRDGRVELVTDFDDDSEPDVIVSGSLLALLRMSGASGTAAIRDGAVEFAGDAEPAQQFQRLLVLARPDPEEALSQLVGDVAAHRLGEMTRNFRRWSASARETMAMNVREYLQEESRDVPSRYEVERFADDVTALRDAVARLEARLELLQDSER